MNTLILPVRYFTQPETGRIRTMRQFFKKKNLHFSLQEEVGNNLFALDVTKRQLMYLKKDNKILKMMIVNLRNVSSCALVKHYHHTAPAKNKSQGFLGYLKKIGLALNIKSSPDLMELPFFEFTDNSPEEMQLVEEKANSWSRAVTGVLQLNQAELTQQAG